VAQSLLGLKLPPQAPVVVLSDNALDHLLLMLAAMHVGRAVCTVSSAYCRLTQDYSKIHGILATLGPALVYASDARSTARRWPPAASTRWWCSAAAPRPSPARWPSTACCARAESPAVMQAFEAILPDDHAKYLLTSGSTGHPKVVINTHRMLCANQQMMAQVWRFLEHEKPVLVDWLPWSHTFGGNHNLNLVLRTAARCTSTKAGRRRGWSTRRMRNLREVQPTLYFNVPRGFDMAAAGAGGRRRLARASSRAAHGVLRRRRAAAGHLGAAGGGGAPRARRREPVWFTTSWGSTETARPSPARTGSSSAPVSSACRCRAGAEVRAQRAEAGDARARRRSSPATATRRT
jgi:feruloyl-CoA synthase